jgi:chaperonin GroEL
MLDRAGGILSTRDGATVAWELEPADPVHRLGVRIAQNVCGHVSRTTGDGTTTTALLLAALVRESVKWTAGTNVVELADGLRRISNRVSDMLAEWRLPVEDPTLLRELALQASGGDVDVAEAIVAALDAVGTEGMIVVEDGRGRGVEIVHKTGMEISGGLESSDLADDEGRRAFEIPLVAIVDGTLETINDVRQIMEEAIQFPHPLVIVSRGCYGKALQTIVANDRKLERPDGVKFEAVAVRLPGRPDLVRTKLEDIAALTGATIIDPHALPIASFRSEHLGSAQRIVTNRTTTTMFTFEDAFPRIEARVAALHLEEQRATHSHDIEEIRTRIARLTDGFCVIRIGGATQVEIRERKGKVEDALNAVKVAVEGGVVPGGGIACLALSERLRAEDDTVEARVVAEALREPLKVLAKNAGAEPPVVLRSILEASRDASEGMGWGVGWDAIRQRLRDLMEPPVLCDPYEVVKAAVISAISAASTMLTADVAIVKKQRAP